MPSVLTLPQGRIPIGFAMVNGQRVEVTIDQEWMRYFVTLTARAGGVVGVSTTEIVNRLDRAADVVILDGDSGGDVEFIPGPQGPQGPKGDPGPALWMLEDPQETETFIFVGN